MGIPYTNEEFLKKLKENNVKHIPIENYLNTHTKIKWMCYKNNKHIFEASPCYMYKRKHDGCIYCNSLKAFTGETDLWTVRPDIASMLLNPDDGYKYLSKSGKKLDWVCPNCNKIIRNKSICNVTKYGLSCPYCSDSMSFSEKIVSNLLSQLNLNFIHDRATNWSKNKRYDFYIPSIDLIIETNGIQHYERSFCTYSSFKRKPRTVEEEIKNDKYKKELALSNGIKYYIELDCRYSNFDYIKNNILKSDLSKIFDLSKIDWNKCFNSTTTSNVIICSDLWNDGIKDSSKISDITGIHISTVIKNLKRASQIGLCDYEVNYNKTKGKQEKLKLVCDLWNNGMKNTKQISNTTKISYGYVIRLLKIGKEQNLCDYYKNRKKKVLCLETNKIYESIASVKYDGYFPSYVSEVCNGKREMAHNLHFKFI